MFLVMNCKKSRHRKKVALHISFLNVNCKYILQAKEQIAFKTEWTAGTASEQIYKSHFSYMVKNLKLKISMYMCTRLFQKNTFSKK